MPYQILKGARPPRMEVMHNLAAMRAQVEARVPAVQNIPTVLDKLPSGANVPMLPRSLWGVIVYPYDVAMRLIGVVKQDSTIGDTRTMIAGYEGKVGGAGYGGGYPRVLSK